MPYDLVLTEPNTKLTLKGELLVVTKEDRPIMEVKLQDLEQVVLFGRIDLTASVRITLLHRKIDTLFFTSSGKYLGRLLSGFSKNSPLRLKQYACCIDTATTLPIAKSIVRGKITNQYRLLLRQQRTLKEPALAPLLGDLRLTIKKIDAVQDRDELLGYEGQAAKLYFQALPHCFRKEGFTMQGRTRRPPRDPINALLSFGYTVLGHYIENAIWKVGLDPYIGCFHTPHYGRPSLALDILEEFRPLIIDALTLSLINRGQIRLTDFYQPDRAKQAENILTGNEVEEPFPSSSAVYLGETGRKIFFSAFYKKLRSSLQYGARGFLDYKGIIEAQCHHMAHVIQEEEAFYIPFTPR